MSKKIYGRPVTTPFNPEKLAPGGGSGADGFSPVVTVTQTEDGTVITITDKDGTTEATIVNGKDGQDGASILACSYTGELHKMGGSFGTSRTYFSAGKPNVGDLFITTSGDVGRVTSFGNTTNNSGILMETTAYTYVARIKGADGTSCTHEWNGTVLTITSASGTSSADLKGEKGDKGDPGEKGTPGQDGQPGADGKDYTLTESDKQEIAEMTAPLVEVPSGGGSGGMQFLGKYELAEESIQFEISKDADGNPFALRRFVLLLYHLKAESSTTTTNYFVAHFGTSTNNFLIAYNQNPYYRVTGECLSDGRVLLEYVNAANINTYGQQVVQTKIHGTSSISEDGKIHSIVLNTGTGAHLFAVGTYIELYGE